MLWQLHNVNTSMESCVICYDKKNRSRNQKNSYSVNEPLVSEYPVQPVLTYNTTTLKRW